VLTRNIGAGTHLLVVRDVSERNRLRDRLLVSDRLSALGLMSASLAHEINNPLACVLGGLEYLGTAAAKFGDPAAIEAITDVIESAERMRVLSHDLRVFARAETGTLSRPVQLRPTIESAIRLSRHEVQHKAHVTLECGEVPPVVGTDAAIGQVFLNLLVNAGQAFPPGKKDECHVWITVRREGPMVIAEVRDDGPGIPPENLARIFEPLFTTKAAGVGTGLGLWVVKQILTGLGGSIAVESERGRGTTIRMQMPVASRTPSGTMAAVTPKR
jgi:signal transduction histidine kinase